MQIIIIQCHSAASTALICSFLHVKHFRYQRFIELPEDSADTKTSEPDETEPSTSDEMTLLRLKQITLDMLKTRCTPEYAKKLIQNLKNHYQKRTHVLCKMTYMIHLNMIDWKDIDKMEFLNWYHQQLRTIAGKR